VLAAEVADTLRREPASHWLDALERAGVPCGPLNDVAAAVRQPQVAARAMVRAIPDPQIGTLYVAGNPLKLSTVPAEPERRPPPALDADRDPILAWLRDER
jgi:CoA:oxalate CoA-transferase